MSWKSCPSTMFIDGQLYEKAETKGEKMRIVIVDNRGLMYVGKTNLEPDDKGHVLIRDARCVVYWGTTKHIAELIGGPTGKTRLGAVGDVSFRAENLVVFYDVADDWATKC